MKEETLLKEYLKQISKIPLLSFEQELDLAQKIQKGDKIALHQLVEANLRLVVAIARRYVCSELPILDLIQEGNIGLITAAEKYVFSYNVRFSTYACWWIQQAITRGISNKNRIIRLPYRKEEMVRRVKKASSELFQIYGKEPSLMQISEYLGCSKKEVAQAMFYSAKVASLDFTSNEEENIDLLEILSDMTFNPEQEFMKKYTHSYVISLLDDLKASERDIVIKRYNLGYQEKSETLKKIGSDYGVSAETIRQIEKKALKKLRQKKEEIRQFAFC